MTPEECRKKLVRLETLSNEIAVETGEACFSDIWRLASNAPFVAIMYVLAQAPAAIDLHEDITKIMICERLLDAHDNMLKVLEETRGKLQRILDGEST